MAFPNSAISDIVATTIENRSKAIADNVTAHNALLNALSKKGNLLLSGGYEMREHFSFAENGNGGSYAGYDLLPTGAQDVISGAQFTMRQYAVPVTFSGADTLMNSGSQALIDLIKSRVEVAESTMRNMINRHLYLDGTGNNGKNITGLAAAVPLANSTGTYGGIDRSVAGNAFWRNKKWQASVDGGGVATASTLQSQWNQFLLQLTRNTDTPDLIIAAPNIYSMFQASMQTIQRVMDADKASAGFKSLEFVGIPVVFETQAAGISSNVAYFLNTDFLRLRTHKDRNFVALDDKQSTNQDATVKTLAWAGNLTCSGAQFQGIFSNT